MLNVNLVSSPLLLRWGNFCLEVRTFDPNNQIIEGRHIKICLFGVTRKISHPPTTIPLHLKLQDNEFF